jgi:uncharacterized protein (TIGR03437 family)
MGLSPFVTTVPTANYRGRRARVLGTDLRGASRVTFNGVDAEFTVISPTEIGAIIPDCATTGPVRVTTPSGTLESNIPFRVLPLAGQTKGKK